MIMSEITIILIMLSFGAFLVKLWKDNMMVNVFSMTISVCGIGAVFIDTALTGSELALVLVPLLVILIFSAVGIMRSE